MICEAARLGLKLNAKKFKTLSTEYTRNEDTIRVDNDPVEDVSEFEYLGAMVDGEGGGDRDIKNRLQKARGAFHRLARLWNTRGIGRKTKIHLFKTLVRPVLLYGCETWKITNKDEKQLDTFQMRCLRHGPFDIQGGAWVFGPGKNIFFGQNRSKIIFFAGPSGRIIFFYNQKLRTFIAYRLSRLLYA